MAPISRNTNSMPAQPLLQPDSASEIIRSSRQAATPRPQKNAISCRVLNKPTGAAKRSASMRIVPMGEELLTFLEETLVEA